MMIRIGDSWLNWEGWAGVSGVVALIALLVAIAVGIANIAAFALQRSSSSLKGVELGYKWGEHTLHVNEGAWRRDVVITFRVIGGSPIYELEIECGSAIQKRSVPPLVPVLTSTDPAVEMSLNVPSRKGSRTGKAFCEIWWATDAHRSLRYTALRIDLESVADTGSGEEPQDVWGYRRPFLGLMTRYSPLRWQRLRTPFLIRDPRGSVHR